MGDKPKPEESKSTAIEFGAVLGLVGVMVAAIGTLTLTGTIGRVLRNDPAWIAIAAGILLLVAAAGVLYQLFAGWGREPAGKKTRFRSKVLVVALVGFSTVAFGIGIWRAWGTADDRARAGISVSVDPKEGTLEGKVTVPLMKVDGTAYIFVAGMKDGEYLREPLYLAEVGPDADGLVSHDFKFGIPPGVDTVRVRAHTEEDMGDCRDGRTGCVTVQIPEKVQTATATANP